MPKSSILIVTDEHPTRRALRERLEAEGYEVEEAASAAETRDQLASEIDLALLGCHLPDASGLELLREFKRAKPDVPVIMLTAQSSVARAVDAMRQGAYHYAEKPFDLDQMAFTVARALEATRLRREVRQLRLKHADRFDSIIGQSQRMMGIKTLLARIAESPASTVLITGESGTGKDLAAKAIHSGSDRAEGPFLNITCSALPSTLLESELFGHERGAFTDAKARKKGLFELATGGTVFLDEIGEMEPPMQAKLLRFLEEKAFRRIGGANDIRPDVRIIAATNVDLLGAVKKRLFREDLYYRLAVLTVQLPPLRDRHGDVELLAKYFVDRFGREFQKKLKNITPGALELLAAYPWPGNIRELRNVVERASLLADKETLDRGDFTMLGPTRSATPGDFLLPMGGVNLQQLEREFVLQALERCGWNQTRAASLLGMNRDQIRYRIEKFNLRREKARADARLRR